MFTGKEFNKHIFSLIGERPYKWATKKGIKPHVIDQLKRPKIPGMKILDLLSVALGKDVNELIGKETIERAGEYDIRETGRHKPVHATYRKYATPEEQGYVNKLLDVLRNNNEPNKKLIKSNLDIMKPDK